LKQRYLANNHFYIDEDIALKLLPAEQPMHNPFYPRFWPDRLRELRKRKQQLMDGEPKPIGVFVCDMSDLFGTGIPEEWTSQIMDAIWDNDEYDRFYLLTKQPQNLIKFSPFPDNCWVGVTVTDNAMFWKALSYLKDSKATIKYLSIEPYLEAIEPMLSPFTNFELSYEVGVDKIAESLKLAGISWVILGSQTKPYKPPKKLWIDEITEACKRASIPYFLKDNLQPLFGNNLVQDMPIDR